MLYKDLLAAGTTATGTVRCNRNNFPDSLKGKSKQPRGSSTVAYHNNITLVKWHDNRDVYAISALHSNSMTKVKCQVDENVVKISCPAIIED